MKKAISISKKVELMEKIQKVEQNLIDERRKERLENERKVVEQIKENPKVLFSYEKRKQGEKKLDHSKMERNIFMIMKRFVKSFYNNMN